ncbi:MAG: 30S ribosomal protein S11 [Candidatus Moeniiplasma glomeromycotorum]|nr:30S ribosomal protein S11 [Candidatus Moeniiplasma glomeromycotorum]MCE8167367.1 30S ribosomal protein S11 [Candidatus Moeniiplasma glomeromycotorum]MCE8168620.1 30S ribosomal protein S11 [Candidatus Moeniiplasma glomeromycotorum]
MATIKKKLKKKKKEKRTIPSGQAIIFCNFTRNNTRIDLSDLQGNILKSNSGGMVEERPGGGKFTGSKKTSEIVTDLLVKKVEEEVKEYGIREVVLTCKGNGPGRKQALEKLFRSESWEVMELVDKTPLPLGGGCRPPTRRRI